MQQQPDGRTTMLMVGHSHLAALVVGWQRIRSEHRDIRLKFVNLRADRFLKPPGSAGDLRPPSKASVAAVDIEKLRAELEEYASHAARVLCLVNGNQHNIAAFSGDGSVPLKTRIAGLERNVAANYAEWLSVLQPLFGDRLLILLPPPPIESEQWIRENPGPLADVIARGTLMVAAERKALWEAQCRAVRAVAREFAVPIGEAPAEVFSSTGFLAEDCRRAGDSTHANEIYGARALQSALSADLARGKTASAGRQDHPVDTRTHPYAGLPDYAFWSRAISRRATADVDPVVSPLFRVRKSDRVATAGSCFAQHISRRLEAAGFDFMVVEDERAPSGQRSYDFSARYGNIYTARQLLQLFDRAFGYFVPLETAWLRPDGRFCDPFRPRVDADGHAAIVDVQKAAEQHLRAVRRMFCELDVFVFTLGLTECFASRLDGAVYPLAPGVAGGEFDAERHEFLNFSSAEVTADLRRFMHKLALVNPGARVILTVSPVPLVATRSDRHVLVATTYSKAALRVAAEEISRAFANVMYFPSYEIITGPHAGGEYFGDDRRSVTAAGVDHVMRVFMSNVTDEPGRDARPIVSGHSTNYAEEHIVEAEAMADLACEEVLLDLQDSNTLPVR
ncbi:MAG: GSCFA domain-containing protein [Sinimarinibacterium flocculans]|uniref:GSCFA domain-containing protein n=1 Tax=Sinimarinibacterium flocculans TaxID=985250 RepID=UPI003C62A1B9